MTVKLVGENLKEAIELQRKFWTYQGIAEKLGVTRESVCRALSRYNRRVHAKLEKRAVETKAKQIRQLEWMAEQAVVQWERSTQDAESIKTVDAADGTRIETTVKGQTGNPSLLSEARGAMSDVRKILGLDAPSKSETNLGGSVQVNTPNSGTVEPGHVATMLDEMRALGLAVPFVEPGTPD